MSAWIDFYKGKKVLITGNTGFKGSWMCEILKKAGAHVYGYALKPEEQLSLYKIAELDQKVEFVEGDIRDLSLLLTTFKKVQPEIVIHMAAQPLVRESYESPVYTFDVNIMGTVNVLECIRMTESVKSFLNVTTDKVYANKEWVWGYRENEELNGFDPYSNSKSCSELVTSSYKRSFFSDGRVSISTARAGNVIGGGDFAKDRIIPDCIRAAEAGQSIIVRNPYSMRPFQHVLEPVMAYLLIAKLQYENVDYADCYNIGPKESDCLMTGDLTSCFCTSWKKITGKDITWVSKHDGGPHEATILRLDCSKFMQKFQWAPVWNAEIAVQKVVEWQYAYMRGQKMDDFMDQQIEQYLCRMESI